MGVVVTGPPRAVGDVSAEDVVVHEEVVVARVLESLDQDDDRVRIDLRELALWEDGSESHHRSDPGSPAVEAEHCMAHWEDVLAIREVIDRYCLGADRRTWDLVRSCFTPECAADYE